MSKYFLCLLNQMSRLKPCLERLDDVAWLFLAYLNSPEGGVIGVS